MSYAQAPPVAYQSDHLRDPHIPLRVGRSPARGRFLKALILAVTACALLGLTTHTVVNLGVMNGLASSQHLHDETTGPIPADGDIFSCLDGASWINDSDHPPLEVSHDVWEVSKSFELPLDSEELYFLSRGSRSFGHINFVTGDSNAEKAVVKVTATYNHDEVIESAKVCLLTKDDEKKHGFGIYVSLPLPDVRGDGETCRQTPHRQMPRDHHMRLTWKVEVTIPEGTDLNALSTHMPIFPHHLNAESLTFKNLDLATSNAPIRLESVNAVSSTVETSNAPITGDVQGQDVVWITSNGHISGSFTTSSKLKLKTTNAGIDAQVTLNHLEGSEGPVSAVLETANGKVHGTFDLRTDFEAGLGGRFSIEGRSANAPVLLNVNEAPADSDLDLTGVTSIGPVKARLPPAYEGSFQAATSLSRAVVEVLDVEDPKGDGRKRTVKKNQSEASASGSVHWGDEKRKTAGNVKLSTSLGPVELVL